MCKNVVHHFKLITLKMQKCFISFIETLRIIQKHNKLDLQVDHQPLEIMFQNMGGGSLDGGGREPRTSEDSPQKKTEPNKKATPKKRVVHRNVRS